MRKLTAISLFTGAMGLDLGVEKAGFEIKAAVEINKNACETIKLNRPELPLLDKSVNYVSGNELLDVAKIKKGKLDLLVGGPPCQSFSTAGRRRSLADSKGDCIFQFIRLLEELEPKTFIMENVRGILSSKVQLDDLEIINDKGQKQIINCDYPVHEYIIKRMIELGYNVDCRLLNSADYGVPQKRERVFFIGTKLDKELNFPKATYFENPKKGQKRWKTFNDVLVKLKQRGIEKHHYNEYTKDRKKYMEIIPKGGGNWRDLPDKDVKIAMGKAYYSGGGKVGFFRRIKLNEPTPTLLTSPIHKSTMLGHPLEDRPLSIEEYMEIQQFPDNWELPDSLAAKYMLIGNAVPVGLAYAVAKEIAKHIKRRK
jgi:DNA (cytosine-5)-methyltransferase 1